ncbi:MAG: hypothetical protein HC817_05205, partial [Saprospiraceae bacterium]|nr:hypothetical protein [Saprospiraceae bacterium]
VGLLFLYAIVTGWLNYEKTKRYTAEISKPKQGKIGSIIPTNTRTVWHIMAILLFVQSTPSVFSTLVWKVFWATAYF